MSGRYLLDTNAIIYAINRNLVLPAGIYAVSVITKLELFCWPSITPEDEEKLEGLFHGITVIQLESAIQDAAIKIRKNGSLKLPDSIISATALTGGFVLVTDDAKLRSQHVGQSVSLDELTGKA